jgi:hypothetical protein
MHGTLTIFWAVIAIPIMLFIPNAVWVVNFMSVYTIVIGHWGSWQTTRVEVNQEDG